MAQAVGGKVPGNDAGHVKNESGQVCCGQTCDLPEDNHEHDGGQERLNKKPQGPEERLLVRGYEISFNQQQVQLAIGPKLSWMAASTVCQLPQRRRASVVLRLRWLHRAVLGPNRPQFRRFRCWTCGPWLVQCRTKPLSPSL